MQSNHKNYLSNMRQVLLFFFSISGIMKNNTALQNNHWNCLKYSIILWALDIFPVFTRKNQNCTENQSI